MIFEKPRWILLIVVVGIIQLAACTSETAQNEVSLSPADDGYWNVAYRLTQPTTALTFVRTPDNARSLRWQFTSSKFEIGQSNGDDVIRRVDGGHFSSVNILVPATYVPLPKDYAPFSPFSDRGLLIHSGRFQACPTSTLQTIDDCDGPWLMQITAPPGAHILLNGQKHGHSAQWSDSDDGTNIYVGAAMPRSTPNFVGVVDPALPPQITDLIEAFLPKLMDGLAQRLPPLQRRPMMFVSYDSTFEQGHGRQGGTLPDQVFMHFYGPGWDNAASENNTPEEIAWFFAHETGHLFQHGVSGSVDSSWIHEGAAEAFAYFMLEDLKEVSKEYLATRRQRALDGCRDGLSDGTLAGAAERGSYSDYYDCGLIMFLAIDAEIRVNTDDQLDLFGFWTTLISDAGETDSWDSMNFLKQLEISTGPNLAEHLLSLVVDKQDDPAAALDRLGIR